MGIIVIMLLDMLLQAAGSAYEPLAARMQLELTASGLGKTVPSNPKPTVLRRSESLAALCIS